VIYIYSILDNAWIPPTVPANNVFGNSIGNPRGAFPDISYSANIYEDDGYFMFAIGGSGSTVRVVQIDLWPLLFGSTSTSPLFSVYYAPYNFD